MMELSDQIVIFVDGHEDLSSLMGVVSVLPAVASIHCIVQSAELEPAILRVIPAAKVRECRRKMTQVDLDSLVIADRERRSMNLACSQACGAGMSRQLQEYMNGQFVPISLMYRNVLWGDTAVEKLASTFNLAEMMARCLLYCWLSFLPPRPERHEELMQGKRLAGINQVSRELMFECESLDPNAMEGQELRHLLYGMELDGAIRDSRDRLSGVFDVDEETLHERGWPSLFRSLRLIAQLRNKTKGHGIMTESLATSVLVPSFRLVAELCVQSQCVLKDLRVISDGSNETLSGYNADMSKADIVQFKGRDAAPWLVGIPEKRDVGFFMQAKKQRYEYLLYHAGELIRPSRTEVDGELAKCPA